MPKLEAAVETGVELSPALEAKFRRELALLNDLYAELADTQGDIDALEAELERMREKTGGNVHLDGGWHVTRVTGGTTKSLDKKALRKACGLTEKQFNNFYVDKPKKDYTLITMPKDEKAAAGAPPRDERDTDE